MIVMDLKYTVQTCDDYYYLRFITFPFKFARWNKNIIFFSELANGKNRICYFLI